MAKSTQRKQDPRAFNKDTADLIASLQSKMGEKAKKMGQRSGASQAPETALTYSVPDRVGEGVAPSVATPATSDFIAIAAAPAEKAAPSSDAGDRIRFSAEGLDIEPASGGGQIRFSMSCTEKERLAIHHLQARLLAEGFPMSYAQVLRVAAQALIRGGAVERRVVKEIHGQDGRRKKA